MYTKKWAAVKACTKPYIRRVTHTLLFFHTNVKMFKDFLPWVLNTIDRLV
jgi:hypothetical protein